ncbi:MAG: hypothetical protein DWH73_02025 [Planctomycetota bacterium]|nr:MAG: hypothetical protein DWH73_02025 [Planctomycetota bacterium]
MLADLASNPSISNRFFDPLVVAATHDTSYQNDAEGNNASSRWLSEATPSGHEMGVKAAGTPAGGPDLMPRCRPLVSSLGLLNHRLLSPDASGIVSIKNLPFMTAKSIIVSIMVMSCNDPKNLERNMG